MFHVPEYFPDISLKLSRVLEETGVNETVILKRRRTIRLNETLCNIGHKLLETTQDLDLFHCFGSQVEGTITPGLFSDCDFLISNYRCRVIQDWGEWEPDIDNLLMIQEETTPPGYCMLQCLCNDIPIAVTEMHDEHHVTYRGKMLRKNTYMNKYLVDGQVKNGPAGTLKIEGGIDQDLVFAFPFKMLPEFLVTWLQQQTQKGKLSQDMKRYIESKPCYVVSTGRKDSSFEAAEWRISTSHAERCLMFNLNITQLQCYTMLKLLLKTHLQHPQEKALSSFMCKNILLLCIGKTDPSKWIPQNLLSMFTFVLHQLQRSILQEYCPHFIINENNLMAQKFTTEVKSWLLEKIQFIRETHGFAFLGIEIDDIGDRLQTQLNTLSHCTIVRDMPVQKNLSVNIAGDLLCNIACTVTEEHSILLKSIFSGESNFVVIMHSLRQLIQHGDDQEQAASRLLTPLFYSSAGSLIASGNIREYHPILSDALSYLSLGLNSDVASSRLKLASVYYCSGDFNTTEYILRSIEETYDPNIVEAVCGCYIKRHPLSDRFCEYANTQNEPPIPPVVAYCVKFVPQEVHCQPRELQYEMYKSTREERANRNHMTDFWMDWAVVDSLPYLYFLQYKTYGHLQRYFEQQQALNILVRTIYTENLKHKETALNLIGQCYMQEKRYTEALYSYVNSLKVRPTNNAAKIHLCRLLYAIITVTMK